MAPKSDPVVWQKYIGGYSDSMRYLATQLILFQNRIIISILLEQKDFFIFFKFQINKVDKRLRWDSLWEQFSVSESFTSFSGN